MIIHCPECGREVSDKAPTCPSCGVEIAGKVKICQQCGKAFFPEDGDCPNCHGNMTAATTNDAPRHHDAEDAKDARTIFIGRTPAPPSIPSHHTTSQQQPAASSITSHHAAATPDKPKKKPGGVIALSLVFSLIIVGTVGYFYLQGQRDRENEDYTFAMTSADMEVLKNYLMVYPDAPAAHRDSIMAHLEMLQKGDEEWDNAIKSNSRTMLQQYIEANPSSLHIQEALLKIDSLDWIYCQKENTLEAVAKYLSSHPDGRYYDEACIMQTELEKNRLTTEESDMVLSLFSQFFQGLNMHDEELMTSTVSMVLDNFLGKSNATANDVVTFLNKMYKGDIDNMDWQIDKQSIKLVKTTDADGEPCYQATFFATEQIQRETGTEIIKYRISAKVSSDGRISGFEMTKIV